jgi:hypothetical protein
MLVALRRPGVAVYGGDTVVADVQWCGLAYTGVLRFYGDPLRAVPRIRTVQLFIGLACTSHNQHANMSPLSVQIPVVLNCGFVSHEI